MNGDPRPAVMGGVNLLDPRVRFPRHTLVQLAH